MIILDTNVLSALIKDEPDPVIQHWLDRLPELSIWTTTINIFEIRYGLAIMPADRRQSQMLAGFERAVEEKLARRVLSFDFGAAEQAASLMAARKIAGRPIDLRDTMIAGIALVQRATLATRNVRHFDDLDVPVVNPWDA